MESVNGLGSRDRGMPGMVGEKGPEMSIGCQSRRIEQPGHERGPRVYISMYMGPFLVSLVNSPVPWST